MTTLEGRDKAAYVQDMFGRIAARYDTMNRVMTLGQDQKWRRYAVRQANLPQNGQLLDLATGTGDIAFEAAKRHPDVQVIAADFAMPMMLVGRERRDGDKVEWLDADAMNLPFPNQSFDALISAYLLRNVADIGRSLQEQFRVVRPGGRVISLDTSPPADNILKPFILFYLKYIIPLLGRLIAGDSSAYVYLPESTRSFKTADELVSLMKATGFVDVNYKKFMFGTVAIHVGTRPENA